MKTILEKDKSCYCQRPRPQMRKSVSLAEDDTRQKNHSLDTSCQVHNSKARNELAPTSLRAGNARQKKSSVSSFGSNLDSSKVSSEPDQAERRKKFSLCTGSSYDSQLSLGLEQVQQGGSSRQRKLSLVCLPTSNPASSLNSPKVRHYSIIIKRALWLYLIMRLSLFILECNCQAGGPSRCGARPTIDGSKTVQ